jgi:hypothetical protein
VTRWALVLLVVAACGKNRAVALVDEVADAVCACKDRSCADDALARGSERLQGELKDPRGTESDKKAVEDAVARMHKCRRDLP